MKKKGIVAITLIIMSISAFTVWWFFFNQAPPNPDNNGGSPQIPTNPCNPEIDIHFSEVNYIPTSAGDEWFELYSNNTATNLTYGWYINTNVHTKILLPAFGAKEFNHFVFHLGNSSSWSKVPTNYTDHYYLNQTQEILNNTGDYIEICDENGTSMDFITWGKTPLSSSSEFNLTYGTVNATVNHSISIWGYDHNSSINWYDSVETPAGPNVEEFQMINPNVTIAIYNGYTYIAQELNDPNSTKFKDGDETTGPNIEVKGPKTSKEIKANITEYANFSLKLYKSLGYGDPELGPDGKVDIHVANGTAKCSGGSCSSKNGTVRINVGTIKSEADLKYVVEHELFHTIQVKRHGTGAGKYRHEAKPEDWWWDEGMAVFWGMHSAMKNFKLTWRELLDEFYRVSDHNDIKHYLYMNMALFKTWFGSFSQYMGAFMFIKFLSEKYGNQTLLDIHNKIKQYDNGTYVGPKEAIENVTGQKMEDIIREFYQWRILEAPTANNIKGYIPDYNFTVNGTNTFGDSAKVRATGATVQQINVESNATFEIKFKVNQTMIITVMYYKKDGSVDTIHIKIEPGHDHIIPVNEKNLTKIIIIKQNPSSTSWSNITMETNPRPDLSSISPGAEWVNDTQASLDVGYTLFLPYYLNNGPNQNYSAYLNFSTLEAGNYQATILQNEIVYNGSPTNFELEVFLIENAETGTINSQGTNNAEVMFTISEGVQETLNVILAVNPQQEIGFCTLLLTKIS
jgi:hypothetical protein